MSNFIQYFMKEIANYNATAIIYSGLLFIIFVYGILAPILVFITDIVHVILRTKHLPKKEDYDEEIPYLLTSLKSGVSILLFTIAIMLCLIFAMMIISYWIDK